MKEREGIRAKAAKSRRLKRTTPKGRSHKKAPRDNGISAVGAQERVEILSRELREALEQQSATSEVLRLISASSSDLKPVFPTMLEKSDSHLQGQIRHAVLFRRQSIPLCG